MGLGLAIDGRSLAVDALRASDFGSPGDLDRLPPGFLLPMDTPESLIRADEYLLPLVVEVGTMINIIEIVGRQLPFKSLRPTRVSLDVFCPRDPGHLTP